MNAKHSRDEATQHVAAAVEQGARAVDSLTQEMAARPSKRQVIRIALAVALTISCLISLAVLVAGYYAYMHPGYRDRLSCQRQGGEFMEVRGFLVADGGRVSGYLCVSEHSSAPEPTTQGG